jgi:hypothetical protein
MFRRLLWLVRPPLLLLAQVGFCVVIAAVKRGGATKLLVAVAEQPLASVMVTLIAPAGILLCVGPLPVPADPLVSIGESLQCTAPLRCLYHPHNWGWLLQY